MDRLEQACIALTRDTSATDYNLPPKKEKIAIIGAGISGMAALLRLATKKYTVEVFEKTDRVGGRLRKSMDPSIFETDFDEQLSHLEYALHLNHPIHSLDELAGGGFQAVYIATGKDGEDFGAVSYTHLGLLRQSPGWCRLFSSAARHPFSWALILLYPPLWR